ncbi:MAG: phage tail sheath subtilisin-like domain-containing protein [Gaiellaceae bacterium]
MATYLSPGVYVEEVSTGPKPIAGVPTNVAAILGKTEKGPLLEPKRLTDWNGYLSTFGSPIDGSYTAESAFGFFENGGTALYVVRIDNSTLSRWQVTDGAPAASFMIDAASPGGWSAGMDVRVGRDTGGGKGQLYLARVTDAGAIALVAATPKVLAVDTTVGASAGLPVTVSDTAGNSADGTISAVGNGTITVTPTGAATIPASSDVRVFGRAANAAAQLQLAVGSGFQPGDLIRAQGQGATAPTAVVGSVQNIGAGAVLTLSSALSGASPGAQFGAKVVALDATITATALVGGKTSVAPAGLTFAGGDPGLANSDMVRLVTAEGIEAAWDGGNTAFVFPAALSPAPTKARVYAKVSVKPWTETFDLTIPGGASAGDVGAALEGLFAYVPQGSQVVLSKSGGGTQAFTRTGGGAWTTTGGVGNAPGHYVSAVITNDPAQGFDATKGLLVLSPVAPQVGDWVVVGAVGASRITDVEQDPGMDANAYRLVFAANFGVAATGAKWALQAWQTVSFESLRFSISATNAQPGRPVVSETYTGLSLNPAHPRYYLADGVINQRSQLIAVEARAGGATAASSTASLPAAVAQTQVGSAGGLDIGGFRAGLTALERTTEPALLAAPDALLLADDMTRSAALNEMTLHAEEHRRFAVVDLPNEPDDQKLVDWRLLHLDTTYGAAYAPWVRILNMRPNAVEQTLDLPPSGFMMGVFARTDNDRGVWKAPANESVDGIVDLAVPYTQRRQDLLNPNGVNLIRAFPGRGMRIWGARNLTDDTEWRYVNVRRLFLFLESSIDGGTQWVVFEPNDSGTWLRVRVSVENFLNQVWRAGGLAGATPEQAYRVRVGLGQTMTETDIELGLLIIEVAVAPVYPAEFVVFRISHKRLTE